MLTPEQLEKKYSGKGHLASRASEVDVISTGVTSLDFATGIGGLPVGRQVEIFGRPSVGKSTLSYYLMDQVQKVGRPTAYLNLEGEFHPSWAKKVCPSFKLNMCLIDNDVDPGTAATYLLAELASSGDFGMIVFDSIGSMLDDSEQYDPKTDKKKKGQRRAGGQAGLITHMVKMVRIPARRNNCTIVYLNQVRDDFDSMYGVEKTPGGWANEHMAVLRIHLKPGESFLKDGVKIGNRVNAKIVKNKVSAPMETAGWNFWNRPSDAGVLGIDLKQDLLDMAIAHDVIVRTGAYYNHELLPGKKVQGKEAVFEHFRSHPEAQQQVHDELMEVAKEARRKGLFEGIDFDD